MVICQKASRNGGSADRIYWWSAETGYVALPNAVGGSNCFTGALNDLDEIIGSCGVGGISYPAFWPSPTSIPVLLPRLPGCDGLHAGTGLSGNGVAVGYAMKSSKSGHISGAARWTRSGSTWTVMALAGLGGPESFAHDVNDNGWATGFANVSTGKNHAVLWIPGQSPRDLGAIGPESWGYSITPASAITTLIVGVGDVSNVIRGLLWRP